MNLETISLETGKRRTIAAAADQPAIQIAFRHGQCGCSYYAREAGGAWQMVDLVPYGATLDTAATETRILNALRAAGRNVTRGRMPESAA